MTVRTTSTTVLIRRQQRVVKISAAIHTRVTARVPDAIAAGVDAPVGRYSGRYFDNYSRASLVGATRLFPTKDGDIP
jgi:hypothetical protein